MHRDSGARLFWHMDGEYLGETVGPEHKIEVRPGPGSRTLTVMDEAGRSVSRRFEVLSEAGAP